jgi:prophage tail gpP-like protein
MNVNNVKNTIYYLISGCPTLAKNEYAIWHDKICTYLHYSICKTLGIETTETWNSHIPKSVTELENVTVLWYQRVQADTAVLANRPGIIVTYKEDGICLLTDVAKPSDRNIIQKQAENKLKYKNRRTEIQQMWNMKCFVMPAIIGTTGIVSKS